MQVILKSNKDNYISYNFSLAKIKMLSETSIYCDFVIPHLKNITDIENTSTTTTIITATTTTTTIMVSRRTYKGNKILKTGEDDLSGLSFNKIVDLSAWKLVKGHRPMRDLKSGSLIIKDVG